MHDFAMQANNAVVRTWGTAREEPELYNHVDLVQMLDIADLEHGTLVAGILSSTLLLYVSVSHALIYR